MAKCPDCGCKLSRPIAVKFTPSTRREFYACKCDERPLLVGERARDFDREDAESDVSWGPLLWDLGALPAGHPFAEAA